MNSNVILWIKKIWYLNSLDYYTINILKKRKYDEKKNKYIL